ncbi:MAG TPA: molybdopterin-dependent oxidoreductase, partial [Bellilinea sp.]|nr:molybdopterin-dependent oxidoreductase [Bellilinea sp.]
MKVVFADRVHARILRVETTNAEAYPGVLAVILANDVPNNEYGLIVNDQPVLCGIGSPKPYSDRVRFYADNVALVVAESEEAARNAAKLIEIDYEDLPGLFDPRTAIKENNNLVHPDHGSNIFNSYRIRKGDVESAFAEADVVVEDYYETPYQEHAYLQPEAGVSYIDAEGRITVIVGGQWAHEDQEQIAHAL